MKTDIQIAQETKLQHISQIAQQLGIDLHDVSPYGNYKAKVDHRIVEKMANQKDGKLILVSAISPTPAGEGKTTTSIGLADALRQAGKKAVLALREPSLGPVFGIKGGAAGGGLAQVLPMEDINLHFTGDLHAIGAANNLLAAMIDNHIFHGNTLCLDVRRISWRRCLDMNDRQLRNITDGLGGRINGTPREDGFDITVASEIMAIFCLANNIQDLKDRLAKIVVGYTFEEKPVTAGDIGAQGALAALLKDAFNPNLVQTIEGTPAFVHGGPFANIAHGCNSVIATRMAQKFGEYTVTEAGFGADLGAEKFLDIKCRLSGLRPSTVVLVATVRALKHHGGCPKTQLNDLNMDYLKAGIPNLTRHIENLQNIFGMQVVVAINAFPSDTIEEQAYIKNLCNSINVSCEVSEVFAKGGKGALALAQKVIELAEKPSTLSFAYQDEDSLEEKILNICKKVYHASGVEFAPTAKKMLAKYTELGYGNLPVCIAKTQYSFSDNPALLAAPSDFVVNIREVRLSAGAGFVVAISGNVMTMPGLPKAPAALGIDVDSHGRISGLF